MKQITEFLEEFKKPVKAFNVTELREREELWRALWSWLNDEVKYYLVRIGSDARIVKRDYRGAFGELGACKFKLSEVEIVTFEKVYNLSDGQYYYEKKVCKIPASAIMFQEFILEREVEERNPEPELAPLEELPIPDLTQN